MHGRMRTQGIAIALAAMAVVVLGGCAEKPAPRVGTAQVRSKALPPRAPQTAAPRAEAAIAPAGTPTVWRLRAGLNVAALTCRGRGRESVAPAYSRMLSRHRTLLDSAYRSEQRRAGTAGFDRQQTRLYNRFAYQRSPAEFCRTAAGVARQAVALSSAQLPPASPRLVGELERALR